jgi:hypothetical protein
MQQVKIDWIRQNLYETLGHHITELVIEIDCKDYSAVRFKLDYKVVISRTAKITPTKTGQFVTIWKRTEGGQIEPYNSLDTFDFIVIDVIKGHRHGQFVFSKAALIKHSIISTAEKEGKRGIRVYPIWDTAINKQAIATQKWQLKYFIELPLNGKADLERAGLLYTI